MALAIRVNGFMYVVRSPPNTALAESSAKKGMRGAERRAVSMQWNKAAGRSKGSSSLKFAAPNGAPCGEGGGRR
jgi:hypothetical protein